METQRPAPPRWTVRMANRRRYSLDPPELPARIRRETSEDRSHPCAETPHGAARGLPVQYDSTIEPGGLDRVSSPRPKALQARPLQNRADAQDTARRRI